MTGDLQKLWSNSEEKGLTMSSEEMRRRASRFDSRIRRRNLIEYAAAAGVIGIFGWMTFIVPDVIVKIACLTIIAGTLVVVRNLQRYGPAGQPGAGLAADCRAFYRGELVRQRDALRSITRWYLAPFIPGLVLFQAGVAHSMLAQEMPMAAVAVISGIALAFLFAVFAAIRWLNHRAASQLDAEIARLDAA